MDARVSWNSQRRVGVRLPVLIFRPPSSAPVRVSAVTSPSPRDSTAWRNTV